MDMHGMFYELPRNSSRGLPKIRPITTHNKMIYDFCSWRGMLVFSGNLIDAEEDGHCFASDDGKAGLWFGNVDDLWKLGGAQGVGGPWLDTPVQAGKASNPYLMAGYDRKLVKLSHNSNSSVRFVIEVDFLADGTWHEYTSIDVPASQTVTHEFPDGYSAHWVRLRVDTNTTATAMFTYNTPNRIRSCR